MKINKIILAIFVAATTLMVACSEYEDSVVSGPKVSADNPGVFFLKSNANQFEVDQVALSFTLTVARRNGDAALDVPLTVLSDTGEVFNVPASVTFPAGVDTVSFDITMKPTAVKGDLYGLGIRFGDNYVNDYSNEYGSYYAKSAISIWEEKGTAQFYDAWALYKVAQVRFWQSTQNPNDYRISFPYSEGILLDAEWEGWIGGNTQDYIIFSVYGDNSNVKWNKFWYTNLLYEGTAGKFVKAYLPSAINKAGDDQSLAHKDGSGNIDYLILKPYIYIDGTGGYGLQDAYVGFPGYDLAGALGLEIYTEK